MRAKDWRTKAALQRCLAALPRGERINYLFQRATRGLPIPDATLQRALAVTVEHRDNAARHGSKAVEEMRTFEFGAGWDLHVPLMLRALGFAHQTVVDLRPLVHAALVRDVADRLRAFPADATPTDWSPVEPLPDGTDLRSWLATIGITYDAPADARATSLPDASVDLVTSTNTLEHVPPDEIRAIMREMKRIVVPGGLCSFQIDESDHYSHFDASIGAYNFLRFEDREWHRYNNALHFQSRLRHQQYLALFEEEGWTIAHVRTEGNDDAGLAALAAVPLAAPFAGMRPEDLAVTATYVVLRSA